ncbi:1,4-dihydroxy-2-naphthoate polyprenyltransferase [Flavobacterium sp. '19STA2R22 D10 B1']|uniref:1,4-dihydroxy-2-naphthoate polyprenyltransferase n=1 Tax=Flavobacterium aerium TaxID=3037261 RepID=UPI00278BC951|nr:1,4-dihydroxy-2-naphthoate polyprenyltransferase [Flavobacterium sp. '19STA2R22 D10 B1']
MNTKAWIEAARLRTLPLSVSGIILGTFYAISHSIFNWKIVGFSLLTTLGLQILSNFANDYGDGVKGTDNKDRIGPPRAVQSGTITAPQMKKGIIITAVLTFISALLLIYVSFGTRYLGYSVFFIVLGIIAIYAAIKYTVGKNAYGYKGMGDIFVFLFFGLVSVMGTYFLFVKQLDYLLLFPAAAIGFLSVGVLNLNNMRDVVSDEKYGKNTLVVKLGSEVAKNYHYFLVLMAMFLMVIFAILNQFRIDQYLFVLAFVPLLNHIRIVYNNNEPRDLDPQLKTLALSTFLLTFLMSICLIF